MTKNEMKARLELLANLAEIGNKIKEEIAESLNLTTADDIYQVIDDIKEGRYQGELGDCIEKLNQNGYLDEKDERDALTPYIEYDNPYSFEIGVTYPEGHKLAAYLSESDFGTYQTGSMYYDRYGSPLDISLAEIKKGDLAKVNGLSQDNKDIDVMIWSDPYNEDWTNKFTLSNVSIEEALRWEDVK